MTKRIWLVALILGLLLVGLGASTVFAQEPVTPDEETWEAMHEACANGDYESMARWHDQYHGTTGTTYDGMMGYGGMMGGGMMGNGGMMGGGRYNNETRNYRQSGGYGMMGGW